MGRISTTARQMVGRTLVAGAGACGIAGGGEGLPISRPSPRRALLPLWGSQNDDGPSALQARADNRWNSLLETPTQQLFDATHSLNQHATRYGYFAVKI